MQVVRSYLEWSVDKKNVTVLVTKTETSDIDIDYVSLRLGISGHGVPVDVRNELKRKNHTSCALGPIKGVPNLQFISQEDHDRMFQQRNGWSEFRKRYGKNARILSVSRVGFNANRTIALFYSTGGVDRMGGSCGAYVFRLRGGKWIKDGDWLVWNT